MANKGYSIFNVIKDTVTGNAVKTEPQIVSKRISICNECDSLKKPLRICSSCGCQVDAKVRYSESTCPLGKW